MLINTNHNLTENYESLLTKNIIKEKLIDCQRISAKYNLKSSNELEWLLEKIFNENIGLKNEIEIKHMKEFQNH